MKPWEEYGGTTPAGPWEDYGPSTESVATQPERPMSATEQVQRFLLGGTGREPVGEALVENAKQIPRQTGLAARSIAEGLGDVVDIASKPMRAMVNAVGIPMSMEPTGEYFADLVNLPKPQTPAERIGSTAGRTIAGSGGFVGGARLVAAKAAPGIAQKVAQMMAARPEMQAASAAGAGLAGGYAREAGASPLDEFLASLAGGLAAPALLATGQRVAGAVSNAGRRLVDRAMDNRGLNARIDALIESAANRSGVDVPAAVRGSLRADMAKAMQTGELTPDVVRRLVDYRMTGTVPTAGPLTLDPGLVTRQKNLAKIGVSSQDPKLQALAQIENQNAARLVQNLNEIGAGTADDAVTAGQKVINALAAGDKAEAARITQLYNQARDSTGRSALLDGKAMVANIEGVMRKQFGRRWGEFVPAWLKSELDDIAKGGSLTVDDANILKTLVGNETASAQGNARFALRAIRNSLDDVPLVGAASSDARMAQDAARAAAKARFGKLEDIPALQAVVEGVEPDKFVQTYIVGSGNTASVNSVMKLRNVLKDSPEALTAVKNNIAQTLKKAALSGNADEVGRFSQSGYNRALNAIGDLKLKLFFSPEEVQALKAIGRVASYEQFQPTGSAVNNSNTASTAIATILDRIGSLGLVRRIPGGSELLGDPLRNVARNIEAGRLTRIPAAAASAPKIPLEERLMLLPPRLIAPYLLTAQEQ